MSYIDYILFFFVIGFLMIGTVLYEADLEAGVERDIYNYTEETINMDPINITYNNPITQDGALVNTGRVYIILEYFINFLLVTTEQIVKMGVEFGYTHPNIDFETIFRYATYLIFVVIIVMLIKPIGYLLVFIFLFVLWIREKLKERQNKRLNAKVNEEE